MITLDIRHNWTSVLYDTNLEREAVDETTKYFDVNALNDWRYNCGKWDGFTHLLYPAQGYAFFPTGLVPKVLAHLKLTGGFSVHIRDHRTVPAYPKDINSKVLVRALRYYQDEAASIFLKMQRGIISLPMGTGKTITAISLIATLNVKTLWITHESALAHQVKEEFEKSVIDCPEIGMYGGGEKSFCHWTIGLVQSLALDAPKIQEELNSIQFMVIDECHHVGSPTFFSLGMQIPAPFRLGLSYTPFERSDKANLPTIGCIGDAIYTRSVEELKEFVSRPEIELIHLPKVDFIISDWHELYTEAIVENPMRNEIILDRAMRSIRDGIPCLIFVARVAHGIFLQEELAKMYSSNVFHDFISGKSTKKTRLDKIDKLRNGELRVLIATDNIAGEGKDIPTVGRIIVGGGMKAPIIAKQRIGRGMRPEEIGAFAGGWGGQFFVTDFIDEGNFQLSQHAYLRKTYYLSLGAIVTENRDHVLEKLSGLQIS